MSSLKFRRGESLEIVVVSAAGYGDPRERDPETVCENVVDGLLSAEAAKRDYGVVLNAPDMAVDQAATRALRQRDRS